MSRNESGLDRVIRLILGIAAVVGAFVVGFSTFWAWILLVVGVILLFTAAVGFCPLYRVFGINTCKVRA